MSGKRALLAAIACILPAGGALAQELPRHYDPYLGKTSPQVQAWFSHVADAYEEAFVESNGRVVDPQNRNISHSEGQGYGMLIAVLGDDQRAFERMWGFARRSLQRGDGLFMWKYEPDGRTPDINNASDGELLIASALVLGGLRWNDTDYGREAVRIARALRDKLVLRYADYTLLMPGEWARPSRLSPRAVVNLSYYIPFALILMERIDPGGPWREITHDGRRLFSRLIRAPSDWSTINEYGEPNPAPGWRPQFGYDAVRVPLYHLQTGRSPETLFAFMLEEWGENMPATDPFRFNVVTHERTGHFHGRAYDLLHELMLCAETGEAVSSVDFDPRIDNYFAASLYILTVASMYAHHPECFPGNQAP